jgi:hypothetical protein
MKNDRSTQSERATKKVHPSKETVRKLTLSKETVRKLTSHEPDDVRGFGQMNTNNCGTGTCPHIAEEPAPDDAGGEPQGA